MNINLVCRLNTIQQNREQQQCFIVIHSQSPKIELQVRPPITLVRIWMHVHIAQQSINRLDYSPFNGIHFKIHHSLCVWRNAQNDFFGCILPLKTSQHQHTMCVISLNAYCARVYSTVSLNWFLGLFLDPFLKANKETKVSFLHVKLFWFVMCVVCVSVELFFSHIVV